MKNALSQVIEFVVSKPQLFLGGLLVLSTSGVSFAQNMPPQDAVFCKTTSKVAGHTVFVEIQFATQMAKVSYGSSLQRPLQVASYQTKKSNSADLKTAWYEGDGFWLELDEVNGKANLSAIFNGESLDISNLTCEIQMFGRSPSVTMSN